MRSVEGQRRRVRAKSVLLSSYRKRDRDWEHWLEWEVAKPLIPISIITALHAFGWVTIPLGVVMAMIAGFLAWTVFVVWNAWAAFRRLDKKRLALLHSAGVECDLSSMLANRRAWAAALQGKTMREVLDGPPLDSDDREQR